MPNEEITRKMLEAANNVITNIDDDEKNLEAFDELVKKFLADDIYLSDYVTSVTPRELAVIYISTKLINDVWSNLATDATFGMEYFSDNEKFKEFQLNISQYIKFALEEEDEKSILLLHDAIESYFELVVELEKLVGEEIKK